MNDGGGMELEGKNGNTRTRTREYRNTGIQEYGMVRKKSSGVYRHFKGKQSKGKRITNRESSQGGGEDGGGGGRE